MALKEKLVEMWGADCVAPISNWNTLQLRSLIKDISKFYDVPFTEANTVTSVMIREATPEAKKKHGIKAGIYAPTWEETMEFSPSLRAYLNKYPAVKAHVEGLVGQVRQADHRPLQVFGVDLARIVALDSPGRHLLDREGGLSKQGI